MKRTAVALCITTVALAACVGARPTPTGMATPVIARALTTPVPSVTSAPSASPAPPVTLTLDDVQTILQSDSAAWMNAVQSASASGLSDHLTGAALTDATSIIELNLKNSPSTPLAVEGSWSYVIQKILESGPETVELVETETATSDEVVRNKQTNAVVGVGDPKGTTYFWTVTLVNEGGIWKISQRTPAPTLSPAEMSALLRAAESAYQKGSQTNNPTPLSRYFTGPMLSNVTRLFAKFKANGVYDDYTSSMALEKVLSGGPKQIVLLATETVGSSDDVLRDVRTKQVVKVLNPKGTKTIEQFTFVNVGGAWKISELAVE